MKSRHKKEERRRRELDRQRYKVWVLVPTRKRFETIKAALRVHAAGWTTAVHAVHGDVEDLRIGMLLQEAGFREHRLKWLHKVEQVRHLPVGFKLAVGSWQWALIEDGEMVRYDSPKILEACKKKQAAVINL